MKQNPEPTIASWVGITNGLRAVYSDDGVFYHGSKGETVGGKPSSGRKFLLVESLDVDNSWWTDTYFDVFRPRDHRNMALIHISCCGYGSNYALARDREGWASDTDLIYTTGANNTK